ncbi:alpha-L-rhamnosidase N-terminal domain-containing protein [Neobacillus drentensis]|uniref:alpha-L-rhamnosidase N-terminal domain-containing protein n=1 Tax=Neobacillus drentensis TaxID=220684 RepID=UPI001F1A89E0|nr:alpha-L-rhamnosidase N-terminal domain-containing protein [Neobacillus drentensis]ULT54945.1 alpha-L-rhamnosidase N-terminal domain-containing protein [Neobacillus drentensis]
MLRKETPLKGEIKSARLYISSLGVFDAFINGKKLGIVNGDGSTAYGLLAPGWTSYDKNINYMTYDVTDYLQGKNSVTLAAVLGMAGTTVGSLMGLTITIQREMILDCWRKCK